VGGCVACGFMQYIIANVSGGGRGDCLRYVQGDIESQHLLDTLLAGQHTNNSIWLSSAFSGVRVNDKISNQNLFNKKLIFFRKIGLSSSFCLHKYLKIPT
jgi:hypothetical protein